MKLTDTPFTSERDRRPLAVRVRDSLLALFADQQLHVGDQLPTEAQLIEHFGVARTTIREACKLLEQQGYIVARQGRGRFLTPQATLRRPLTRLEGVTDMLAAHGLRVDNTTLSVTVEPAGDHAGPLGIDPDSTVVRLERARGTRSRLFVYSSDIFPARLLQSDLEDVDWTGSLFELLATWGAVVASAVCTISASTLPAATAAALAEDPDAPWLVMVQHHHAVDGVPILVSHDYHRGSEFSFTLVRSR